jgi:ethanolamine utilization protein EutN
MVIKMRIGLVTGMIVSTQKDERLVGCKLLVVRQLDAEGNVTGGDEVAIDVLGAGVGERVLICQGSPARAILSGSDAPVDLAVVGIIDEMEN